VVRYHEEPLSSFQIHRQTGGKRQPESLKEFHVNNLELTKLRFTEMKGLGGTRG
jgi:hypothetical protein